MTDTTPAGAPAPKRTPAAKTPAAKTPAAKAPAAKTPAVKTPAAKAPAAKAPVTKAATTPKTAVTKSPVTRAAAAKAPAVKAPAVTAPTAKARQATPAAASVPAVEPTPSTVAVPAVAAPAAAVAPAGWYPVAVGSAQQRWWDGSRWTDHVYDPPVATAAPAVPTAATPVEHLRAPEGTAPGTVWFWLLCVAIPVLTILDYIPISIYLGQIIGGDTSDPAAAASSLFSPAYLLVSLSGWFISALAIVFGALDWRELRHRGVPKPFNWAWGFFVLLVGWPAVYAIGRAVIVKRRTGRGLAPLWVFIGLEVVAFIVGVVVVVGAILQVISLLGDGLSAAGNVL